MEQRSLMPVEIVRKAPAIWLSRLLILESIEPWKEIRSVDLHRGLNIVWSNDEAGDERPLLTGHGVGKTTFCRLIRFCLGETTYAHADLAARIKTEYPAGWVAADVHVSGTRWSVARPFGRGRSLARADARIEDLISDRTQAGSYDDFKKAVVDAALAGFPTGPVLAGNRLIAWDHLLAWCTRDQEARFQSFWDWRSPRSETESIGFQRPKQDPVLIVRASLGLLSQEESETQSRIAELERLQKDTIRKIEERKREPEFWVRKIRSDLKLVHQIEDAEHATLDRSELLSLSTLIDNRHERYANEIRSSEERLKDLDRRISMIAAQLNELEPVAHKHQAATDATRTGSDVAAGKVTQLEGEKELLESHLEGLCTYGDVRFGDCSYVKTRLERFDEELRDVRRNSSKDIASRDQMVASMDEAAARMRHHVEAVRMQLQAAQSERRDVERSVSTLESRCSTLVQARSDLAKWQSILDESAMDPAMSVLVAEERRLGVELEGANQIIAEARHGIRGQLEIIREVFNSVVQAALSPEFRGAFQLEGSTPEFSIFLGTALAGEAISSLSVLLGDLTCMLLGVAEHAIFPGFLIHDCPREADLGSSAYACYLSYVSSLHEHTGGAESAPFQYILTTTTAPPVGVRSKEHVCLKLSSERDDGLLFRRRLGQPLPDPQGTLPFHVDQQ